MKFLLKVAILAAAAKFVLHTPEGVSRQFDKVSNFTVRDITNQVDAMFERIGATLKSLLS
jgi:hypothetical protein